MVSPVPDRENGSLKKYLGQNVKVLGMGMYGSKPEDYDGQCKRAQDLKINMTYQCCTSTAEMKGCALPNNFYTKLVNRKYCSVDGKKTTLNTEFQNLRIKSSEAGTGQAPFPCVVTYQSGPKQGSSCLVYWDDSKSPPLSQEGGQTYS